MRSTAGGVKPRPRECLNASLRRARTPRLKSPRCQAILGASEDLPLKSRIYAPTLKAMKVTSDVRSELERELFGADAAPAASPLDLRTLTSVLRATKTWREARDVIAAAERVSGGPDAPLMSAALTALPKLARKLPIGPDGERQQLQNAAVDLVRRHLHRVIDDLDAAELTGVAVGLAKLGCGDAVVFQELARGSVAHMQSGAMTGTMLSNLAWAMATAGVRPCGAWLSEFWMELEDQVDALSSQDIANIFWSICRLELTPPWVVHPGPAPILKAALECVGLSSSGQDPATVLVCLAIWSRSYSYHPPEEQLAGMLAAMQKHLPSYLPQDLVSVVHSLVVLNANPSRAWMTDFYMVLREHLVTDQAKSLPMADFQRLLWALSRIDFVPSQAWLKQFVEVSIVKLRHLRFRALSELVWALACWGYTPTREWLDEYFRCTLNKLQEYKTQHLAISILALKKLGCKVPSPWLDAALTSFCAQLDASRAHDLITFIDGIVDVCDDASWMSRPATATRLRALASYAASKFDICDCVMHAKLLIALATAKCCPGPAWLSAQQDSFGRSLAGEEPGALDLATAGEVRAAYAAWDVPLSSSLGAALGDISGGNGAVGLDGK